MRAFLIGATGLVGRALVSLALEDEGVTKLVTLVRRASGVDHPKLEEHVVDLASAATWPPLRGDVLFSTLGTTLKIAGSKEAQRAVDYDMQLGVARAAAAAGVPTYVLVSSMGASPTASSFYTRMKGELERDVQALGFARVRILRPSFLQGDRAEARFGERIAGTVTSALSWVPGIAKAKPVEGRTVARAMLVAARDPTPGVRVLDNTEIHATGV